MVVNSIIEQNTSKQNKSRELVFKSRAEKCVAIKNAKPNVGDEGNRFNTIDRLIARAK